MRTFLHFPDLNPSSLDQPKLTFCHYFVFSWDIPVALPSISKIVGCLLRYVNFLFGSVRLHSRRGVYCVSEKLKSGTFSSKDPRSHWEESERSHRSLLSFPTTARVK